MSRTIRRKNSIHDKQLYLLTKEDVDSNGLIKSWYRNKFVGLTLEEANKKISVWFHSCTGPAGKYCPGKGYRQEYRTKSKQQLKNQLIHLDDYEGIQIDKLCNDWRYW